MTTLTTRPIDYDRALLEIEAQRRRFEQGIRNIAAAVRWNFVEPFCKKHKLRFVARPGTYGFYTTSDAEFTLLWEKEEDAPQDFLEMEKMLHIEVTPTTHLYQYMCGILMEPTKP